jgi:hypothetical protein
MVDNDLPSAEDDFISVSKKFLKRQEDPRGNSGFIMAYYLYLFNKKIIPLPLDKGIAYEALVEFVYGFGRVSLGLQDLDIEQYLDLLYEIEHPES